VASPLTVNLYRMRRFFRLAQLVGLLAERPTMGLPAERLTVGLLAERRTVGLVAERLTVGLVAERPAVGRYFSAYNLGTIHPGRTISGILLLIYT
jgi:hypothetical protein